MPNKVEFNNDHITFGSKGDLTKLAIKHAAVAADTGDLSKAVAKLETLPDGLANLHLWLPAVEAVRSKLKIFKQSYGKKHPKFISAVEELFLSPFDVLDGIAKDTVGQVTQVTSLMIEAEQFIRKAETELNKKTQDAQTFGQAVYFLTSAGSLFRGASESLRLLEDSYGSAAFKKAFALSRKEETVFTEVNKILELATKANRFDIDLTPVLSRITAIPMVIKAIRQTAAAG